MPIRIAMAIFIACTASNMALAQNVDDLAWEQVPDSELGELRAGFVLDNGMVVNIRFDKQLFVNGDPVSQTYFDSADAMGQQIASFSGDDLNTVLQNSLNDQVLSSVTQMDISISNLAPVQQSMVQSAVYETLFSRVLGN